MTKFQKLGLGLGGGAVLGAAHIGVIRALEEHGIKPDFISGTSIGALVASLYAFGISVDEMEEIAINLDWLDVTSFKLSKMGLLANRQIGKLVLEHIGRIRIEDSKIPLAMIATDISNGDKVVLREGPLYKAVMASTCLPGIFIPVKWEKRLLVDGGLCENVPISPLKEMGARDVIAVDLSAKQDFKQPEDFIDIISNTFDIAMHNMFHKYEKAENITLIQPSLSAYKKTNTKKTRDLIREGYEEASRVLERDSSELKS